MLDDQLIMELRAQLEVTGLACWEVEEADHDVVERLCAYCCLLAGGT